MDLFGANIMKRSSIGYVKMFNLHVICMYTDTSQYSFNFSQSQSAVSNFLKPCRLQKFVFFGFNHLSNKIIYALIAEYEEEVKKSVKIVLCGDDGEV